MSDELSNSIIAIGNETPIEVIGEVLNKLAVYMERGKDLKAQLEERLLERIQDTGEDIVIGTVRYYAGVKKTTKCTDIPGAVMAVMEATGGDMDKVCEAFASQPLKHGYCWKLLGDEKWNLLFEVEEEPELREGKPVKRLQKIDTRFLR